MAHFPRFDLSRAAYLLPPSRERETLLKLAIVIYRERAANIRNLHKEGPKQISPGREPTTENPYTDRAQTQ